MVASCHKGFAFAMLKSETSAAHLAEKRMYYRPIRPKLRGAIERRMYELRRMYLLRDDPTPWWSVRRVYRAAAARKP